MNKKCFMFLIFLLLIFNSCDILRFNFELFKIDYFKVDSWSPYEGYYPDPENIPIWLDFSGEPDRASVERSFLLSANGNKVKGNILWDENKMTFVPLTPLEINTDYIISLTQDARDINGFSMDNDFTCEFTTRENDGKFFLLSYYPQKYEVIDDLKTEIRLVFSAPIPLAELYENVSIMPSMNGSWRLEEREPELQGFVAVFTPIEKWAYGTRYEFSYSTSLVNNYGININKEFSSVFTVGEDNEEPYLLSALRITKDGNVANLNKDSENEGWEKEDRLKLIFSEPVELLTVKNLLSAVSEEGNIISSLLPETSSYDKENSFKDEYVFKFEKIPAYNSKFKINIKRGIKDVNGNESKNDYVFRIFANGPFSKPPEFIGFRMSIFSQSGFFYTDKESIFKIIPIPDEHYPPSTNVNAWIELYFDAAGSINIFSLMELFRIETSNLVINFSPQEVKTENFSESLPHAGWENYQRIEIAGILTNSTNYGVIYVQIGAGLLDSLDNKNEKPQRISVIK